MALSDMIFIPMSTIGFVSRNLEAAASWEDPSSLGWKMVWGLESLPPWMGGIQNVDWKRNIANNTVRMLKNGSACSFYASTGDVASGGRARWFGMDELAKFPRIDDEEALASTQHVTNSRLIISTPKGSEGAFFRVMNEPSSMVKITLHWSKNPTKNRGLYQFVGGVPVAIDPINNPLDTEELIKRHERFGYRYNPPSPQTIDMFSRLRDRGFTLTGKVRSPWFDAECDRLGASPQAIAQELDLDFGGSSYRIFGDDFRTKANLTAHAETYKGVFRFDPDTLGEPDFDVTADGTMRLWCNIDIKKRVPRSAYVIGCDIAAGLGGSWGSNSVCQVIDLNTLEQVCEFHANALEPSQFADTCIAIAKWFGNAYLAWEHNFAGVPFYRRVVHHNYTNIYYRRPQDKKGKRTTKTAGFWTDDKTKELLFSEIHRAVVTKGFKVRSDQLVKECMEYVRINGKIEHMASINTTDESSKGKAHGDRTMALGVALIASLDRPLDGDVVAGIPRKILPGSLAEREAYFKALADDEDGRYRWDSRENSDLCTQGRWNATK
jgi:hypothetical protein